MTTVLAPRLTDLNGVRKAAILTVLLGENASGELFKHLNEEEIEQYDVLLEEQAFPFEEKAIELHETNVQRTGDGVYDEWVQKSLDVLAKLKPARYAKSEVSEDYVPELR